MDKSVFIAMTGASQNMAATAIHANNLANISTTGFKQDLEQARAMPVFGGHFPSRVYAMTERPATDTRTGSLQETGRDLDVAINGQGWLVVQAPDGSEARKQGETWMLRSMGKDGWWCRHPMVQRPIVDQAN